MGIIYLMTTLCLLVIIITASSKGTTSAISQSGNTGITDTGGRPLNATANHGSQQQQQQRRGHHSSTQIDRDNKLMSLLAARRTALGSSRWQPNGREPAAQFQGGHSSQYTCVKNCTNNFTRRTSAACIRSCSASTVSSSSTSSISSSSMSKSTSVQSTPPASPPRKNFSFSNAADIPRDSQNISNSKLDEINTIRDELLEMDESSHVVVVNSKSNGDKYSGSAIQPTKELTNHNQIYVGADDLKPEIKLLPSSASTVPDRNYTKYGISQRPKRIELTRLKLSTTSERSLEEADLYPYFYFGQKLSTIKATDPRNNISGPRTIPPVLDIRGDVKYREHLEDSTILRPTSTEKVKFWANRNTAGFNGLRNINIVAYNNAQRRAQTALVSPNVLPTTLRPSTTTQLRLSSTSSSTSTTTSTPATPAHNLDTSYDSDKTVNTRSAVNVTVDRPNITTIIIPHPMEINHNLTVLESRFDQPTIIDLFNISEPVVVTTPPPLIINIPDVALDRDQEMPEMSPEEINIPILTTTNETSMESNEEIATTVAAETDTEEMDIPAATTVPIKITTTSTTTESITIQQTTPTSSSLPDINYIFSNISTLSPISSSTSTSIIRKFSPTTARPIIPEFFNYTRKSPATNYTTKTLVIPFPTITVAPHRIESTTFRKSSTSTMAIPHRPHISHNESNKTINQIFNISSIYPHPSSSSTNFSSSIPSPTLLDEYALINTTSDVELEIDRINMATYVLGGIGMLPVVLILLYFIKTLSLKKTTKVSDDLEKYIQEGQPISPVVRLDQSETSSVTDESIVMDRDMNRNKLRFKSLLGEGNFGQVWKAEVDDLAGHMGTTRIVAVKAERSGVRHSGLKDEGQIMRKLGSHSNVVTLLGACVEQEPHLLIMEFAMRGRLLSLLRAARSTVTSASQMNPRTLVNPLAPRQLACFSHDIARGMEYIAGKKIVHRDLAARNVLLDHNGICKICDFGMSIDLQKSKSSQPQTRKEDFVRHQSSPESRFRFEGGRNFGFEKCTQNTTVGRARPALPIRWMAPEALQYHIFSIESDVWAFGIVMWEIVTLGCTPYPNLSGREVVRNVPHGARPEMPSSCRTEFADLMEKTWKKDPRQRPTFAEARLELEQFLRLWEDEQDCTSDYLDVSGFSEDVEHGMVYLNQRISEFECEI